MSTKQRILVIDGSYFAHRVLGALNMGDNVNHLLSGTDKDNFLKNMKLSLIGLYENFKPYINNIIFTTDNKSWRKSVKPFKPYYITPETYPIDYPIGYKEQRKAKKADSPIDYDAFYMLTNEFIESLKSNMIVFDIEGCEADDNICLISNKIKNNSNIECICFCTDGDLIQTVRNNFMLMRNITSSNEPFGEFVISFDKYCEIFERDKKMDFLNSNLDITLYKNLFSLSLKGPTSVTRTLNKGITIATPNKIALLKSIMGDPKDNIFSLLSWKSSTGTINYKLTEKHILKALESSGLMLTEENCKKILNDNDLLTNLLLNLKVVTKQNHVPIKKILEHLRHNIKLNILSLRNIPESIQLTFNEIWSSFEDQITNKQFDDSFLKKTDLNKKDSAINLMANSLPEGLI